MPFEINHRLPYFQKQSSFVADVMGRIETNTDAAAAAKNTDLVVEAIVENLGIKKELFTALDAAAPKWVTQMNISVGSAVGKVLDPKAKARYWGGFSSLV